MADLIRKNIARVDIEEALCKSIIGKILAEGDAFAHRFGASIYRKKAEIDLSGHAVTGYFIRPDESTIVIEGVADGNLAYVDLPQACYAQPGLCSLAIKVSGPKVVQTVRMVIGSVASTTTDDLIDPGESIPSLDEIFARIELMEKVTEAAQSAVQKMEAKGNETEMHLVTDGHLWRIVPDTEHEVTLYTEADGVISESNVYPGSDYMLCPKRLCFTFEDDTSRCWLYFYDLVDGEFVPRWDILNTTTSTGAKNYINPANNVKARMLDIPDGVYMRFAPAVDSSIGSVDLYGWDGEPFGMPLSTDAGYRTKDGQEGTLHADGSSGLTIPGAAKYVCCGDAALLAIYGCKDGVFEGIDTDDSRRFVVLPDGYDFFRMRLYFGKKTPYEMRTYVGNVSDLVSVAVVSEPETATARAGKVLEACRKVCGLTWTAQAEMLESSKENRTYKPGVQYNGIPYSSQWGKTHFVGWHVSPHTYVNAAADPESVLYKEVADNGEVQATYYGLVCSSFATLCDGWPYPQTNAGFVYDPMVQVAWSAMPPIGAIYTDIASHCLIPERIDRMDGVQAVSMFEGVRPVCSRTTRYSNIDYTDDQSKFNSACLDGYMDNYGYVARHMQASSMADAAPYADFDDVEIVTASALPYHGDRCIHTSQDDAVLINIKDSTAQALIITLPGGSTRSVSIPAGAAQVDVKAYLTEDGVYYIHTDTNSAQASFEYRTAPAVTCTVTDGKVSFDRNDWWYAFGEFTGSAHFSEAEAATFRCRDDGDYSALNRDGHKVEKVYCVFYKGEYGAYAVTV